MLWVLNLLVEHRPVKSVNATNEGIIIIDTDTQELIEKTITLVA